MLPRVITNARDKPERVRVTRRARANDLSSGGTSARGDRSIILGPWPPWLLLSRRCFFFLFFFLLSEIIYGAFPAGWKRDNNDGNNKNDSATDAADGIHHPPTRAGARVSIVYRNRSRPVARCPSSEKYAKPRFLTKPIVYNFGMKKIKNWFCTQFIERVANPIVRHHVCYENLFPFETRTV